MEVMQSVEGYGNRYFPQIRTGTRHLVYTGSPKGFVAMKIVMRRMMYPYSLCKNAGIPGTRLGDVLSIEASIDMQSLLVPEQETRKPGFGS